MLELPLGAPEKVGLILGLLLGLLGLEFGFAASKPLATGVRGGQLGRQLVAARLADGLIVVGVSPGRLLERLLDVLTDRVVGLGRAGRDVAGDQTAIDTPPARPTPAPPWRTAPECR